MIQTTRATSPLKGVNRAFARESQPDGTCWDAVNVLPQDRYGRLRIGQRSGLGQLSALDGVSPIRLLHVASLSRTPGAGATGFTRAGSAELNDNYFSDTPADAATFHPGTRRNVGISDSNIRESLTGNTGYAKISTVGGNAGLRAVNSVTFADTQIAYVMTGSANGDSTTWLAASDTIWFEMGVHWRAFDGSATGQSPFLGIVAGIPLADMAEDTGAAFPTVLFVEFSPEDSTGVLTEGALQVGTTTSSLTPLLTFTPFTFSSSQDYKLIVAITATTLTVFVDDLTTRTLIQQFSMVGITPTVANIIDGTAGPQLATSFGETTGGPDTVTYFSVYQAQSIASNISRTALELVGTAGTDTYIGDPTDMVLVANSADFPINASALFLSASTLFNYTYIVDGTSIHRLNLETGLFETFTEDHGTAPQNCNISCAWRGRLILSGGPDDPQNFFASRAGDPLDWDYSQEDPTAAFVGNAAQSGRIGQPVHALIPMSDDILVIGCEQSMWAVRGDIADGGSIDQVTNFAGISSSTSWTRGPDGSLYFVGPRGFFKMNPTATQVEEISQTAYPQFFQQINRSTTYINMIYDADRYGIWVFLSPTAAGSSIQSIFYDFRFQGYWPQDWRNQTNAGPVSAIYWDGYNSDTRYPVLGGYDGFLYAFNLTNRTDNGGTIVGSVTLGPFHPNQGESKLVGLTANFGELAPFDAATPSRWQTSVSIFSGKSAYDITEGTPTSTGLIDWGRDRRTKTMRQRLSGEWFAVMLSNSAAGNYFSLESLELEFDVAGKNRRQR